jgi:hypothetical protein
MEKRKLLTLAAPDLGTFCRPARNGVIINPHSSKQFTKCHVQLPNNYIEYLLSTFRKILFLPKIITVCCRRSKVVMRSGGWAAFSRVA